MQKMKTMLFFALLMVSTVGRADQDIRQEWRAANNAMKAITLSQGEGYYLTQHYEEAGNKLLPAVPRPCPKRGETQCPTHGNDRKG